MSNDGEFARTVSIAMALIVGLNIPYAEAYEYMVYSGHELNRCMISNVMVCYGFTVSTK